MTKRKTTKFLIIFLLLFAPLFINAEEASDAGYQIEVSLPGGPGAGENVQLSEYVGYLYITLLSLVGVAAFGALVYAGLQFMLSDSITSQEEAKKWVWAAIGGLLLGFSAYLILHTINPDLTEINPPTLESPSLETPSPEE